MVWKEVTGGMSGRVDREREAERYINTPYTHMHTHTHAKQ